MPLSVGGSMLTFSFCSPWDLIGPLGQKECTLVDDAKVKNINANLLGWNPFSHAGLIGTDAVTDDLWMPKTPFYQIEGWFDALSDISYPKEKE